MSYEITNILDLLKQNPDEVVQWLLDEFRCTKNEEVDRFVHNKAIPFAKQGLAVTYFVFSSSGDLAGIFALANKTLTVETENISSSLQKKLEKFGKYDAAGTRITVPGILIAQIGKNENAEFPIAGSELLRLAEQQVGQIFYKAGGRIVYLECEHEPKLFHFYESCQYRNIGDRIQKEPEQDDIDYRVYIKFLDPMKIDLNN